MILGIDPGTFQSAYVLYNISPLGPQIVLKGLIPNDEIIAHIRVLIATYCFTAYIEDVGCYGMPVGREVFDMVRFSGRLQQMFIEADIKCKFIPRREIKLYFCNSMKAKDGNIRQALIDRFGEPGTKKRPGMLYGVKADIWSALAIAVYGKEKGY